MNSLYVARRLWLGSLPLLAVAAGLCLPPDFADSATGAAAMVGAIAAFCSAYNFTFRSQIWGFAFALIACFMTGISIDACAYNNISGGVEGFASLFVGAAFTLLAAGIGSSFNAVRRLSPQRRLIVFLCLFTAAPSYMVLLGRFSQPATLAYLVAGITAAIIALSRTAVGQHFHGRASYCTWTDALRQTNRLFVTPFDAYRETLRNTDG